MMLHEFLYLSTELMNFDCTVNIVTIDSIIVVVTLTDPQNVAVLVTKANNVEVTLLVWQ